MATYKKIVDVETMAEVTETTNVLVENAGSLMKVPASAIGGGGNGNFLIIRYMEEAAAPTSLESDPIGVYLANMTFAEFDELLQAGELAGMYLNIFDINGGGFFLWNGYNIDVGNYPDYYGLSFARPNDGNYLNLKFYSDNTIEERPIET